MDQPDKTTSTDYRDEDLKKLMEKNLAVSEEILKITKKLKTHMIMERIFSAFKILIIAVPIALGVIYLPPIIEGLINQYQELLGATRAVGEVKDAASSINLDSLPENLRGLIK